jgi:neutral ceramidase
LKGKTVKRLAFLVLFPCMTAGLAAAADLKVGAAAVRLEAGDSMVISGGIGPRYAKGQEGELRATAVVLEKPGQTKLALVGCDVLFVSRRDVDPAVREIEKTCGIPFANVLVSATHTHHAPSTTRVHGYGRQEVFCRRLREAIVRAVRQADARLENGPSQFLFHLGEEKTVGMNSRLLLSDQTIYWIGPRDDALRPTGPFDPQLPVLAFRRPDGKLRAVVYNHSTHAIGTVRGNVRSPSFYGLAAQQLEEELGGVVCFLAGACGSTHNYTGVDTAEAVLRIKGAVSGALDKAQPLPVDRLASIKRTFHFKIRRFDEDAEDEKVASYCRKRSTQEFAAETVKIFRQMRRRLDPQQGQVRETWLQAVLIGEVAIVAVPAEYFTALGVDVKRRSPFRYTYVASLANDAIGYLPDREAHRLGGYQTWMGLHSCAEVGTGERVADEVLKMLDELKKTH